MISTKEKELRIGFAILNACKLGIFPSLRRAMEELDIDWKKLNRCIKKAKTSKGTLCSI